MKNKKVATLLAGVAFSSAMLSACSSVYGPPESFDSEYDSEIESEIEFEVESEMESEMESKIKDSEEEFEPSTEPITAMYGVKETY